MKYRIAAILGFVFFTFLSCKNPEETKTIEASKEKESKDKNQPNIIVLLCDDLGYGDLSSFGHPVIKTPHLDRLAETGIKLTSFYSAAPVCSPSRVGLLTGRSPNRAGVYDFIAGQNRNANNRNLVHLQEHEITIPALLKSVGYSTCLVGKWHCSSKFNSDVQPQPDHFGFDHWFATHNNAEPSHEKPKNFVRNREKVGEIEGFSSQIIVDEAINWLGKKEDDNPFFLEVTFHEPHEPIASPEGLVQKYLPQVKNREEAEYFANVENVDIAVGRLITYLQQNKLDENTLIVFSSDNGPETLHRHPRAKHSYGSPGELKGMKLWTNEAGFRVPGIINWLGNNTFKGTSNKVVSALDFLPTFCELAGVELPKIKLDGESFVSLLNTGEFNRGIPLLWVFYNATNEHCVAMRQGDWKIMGRLEVDGEKFPRIHNIGDTNEAFVKSAKLTDFVLFNLKEDIAESENKASKNPEVFEKMKTILQSQYSELLKGSHVWKKEK